MAINKVIYGTSTLIDLTADTVAVDTLGKDTTAHDKSGTGITGTLESGSTGGGNETWVWDDGFYFSSGLLSDPIAIDFESNGTTYHSIRVGKVVGDSKPFLYYDDTLVAQSTKDGYMFFSEDNYKPYRKMIFSKPITEETCENLYYQFTEGGYDGEPTAVKQPSNIALQPSKTVEITANGITTVTPDVPYDAIKSVEVVTNVASSGGQDNCYIKKYSASDKDIIHGATPFTFTHNLGRIPRFINITSATTEITAYSLNYITAIADATGIYLSYWDVSGSKNDWNELEVYSNHMSFPSNGFIGKASYVQIGNANESTIDIKVGESGSYFLSLSCRNVIIG